MKRLDRFILMAFIAPFFAILFVVLFVLILQFIWVYIDELVGKGLGLNVIFEFMFWGGCTILPLALPLATLLTSTMALGNLGENNELLAMKAAGIPLTRIMAPLLIASVFISIGAYFAYNKLVPLSYNKIYTLREDILRTKGEIKIPTGTFYDGIEGYILRIDSRNKKTGMMKGVMVYNHTNDKGNTSLTLADSATIKLSENKDYLIFRLYQGTNYQETNDKSYRDTTLQLQRIDFIKQELIIPLENYGFKKTEKAKYGDQIKSMAIENLIINLDSLKITRAEEKSRHLQRLINNYNISLRSQLDSNARDKFKTAYSSPKFLKWDDIDQEIRCYKDAKYRANQLSSDLDNYARDTYETTYYLRHTDIEILKRFSQALACFILFFIGAPLGAWISKGGLGSSAIISILFFVLYYVIDITGQRLANDGAMSVAMGAFISSIILLPIGLFLTWRALNDAKFMDKESFTIIWRKAKNKITSLFKKTRIVYMGTPEFAVAPLDALVKAKYDIAAVVTVADKPSGRGLKVNESAVKKYAAEHNIPVLQPVKLKDPDFLAQLSALKADLFVVVAFRMLPEEVWSMPKLGTFNLHAALLPQYRGAAPINWAIINGERISGATTFMIDKDIDTGGIMLREDCRIEDTDTAGDLHDKLMPIGAELVLETVEGIIEKTIETRVQRSFIQGSEVLKPAPKLTKELCHIDWDDKTDDIYNLIRGLSPYPTAYTELVKENEEPLQMKIFSCEKIKGENYSEMLSKCGIEGSCSSYEAGKILTDGKTIFAFTTEDGAISVTDLQLSGKKRMNVKSFLAGFREPFAYRTIKGHSKEEIEKTKKLING